MTGKLIIVSDWDIHIQPTDLSCTSHTDFLKVLLILLSSPWNFNSIWYNVYSRNSVRYQFFKRKLVVAKHILQENKSLWRELIGSIVVNTKWGNAPEQGKTLKEGCVQGPSKLWYYILHSDINYIYSNVIVKI